MRAKKFFIRAGKLLSAVLFLSVGLSMISQARGITFKIPVELEVKGNAPEETYTFTLEKDPDPGVPVAPVVPVASPSEISVTGSGAKKYNLEFNEITYDQAGTYVYLVKQTKGNKSYFTYDSSVYRVIVKVEDDRTKPAGLTCVYWTGKLNETDKTGRISFVNSYSRGTNPPGGGGDTPPGGTTPGGNTPPNPTQPTPKIPEVQGEVRPFDPVKAIQKVPAVFGAIRKVATGDSSSMALYGLFAATSMCSLFFWGIGQKKKEKKA